MAKVGISVKDGRVDSVWSDDKTIEVTVVDLDAKGNASFNKAVANDCLAILKLEHLIWD